MPTIFLRPAEPSPMPSLPGQKLRTEPPAIEAQDGGEGGRTQECDGRVEEIRTPKGSGRANPSNGPKGWSHKEFCELRDSERGVDLTMEPMSFWQLIENNPEWVAVFSSGLFAIVTTAVIVWQVYVMKAQVRVMLWQGRMSGRHERIQNRLIRLQHEHEWMVQRNREREQLLKLGRSLHVAAGCLADSQSNADHLHWDELRNVLDELRDRLRILDVGTYTGAYDQWFISLESYVDDLTSAVIEDGEFSARYRVPADTPNVTTRHTLKEIDQRWKPISIFLDIEAAIRMEFFDFKTKWDGELRS